MIRVFLVTVPTVLGPVAVIYFAIIIRICCALQEVFHEIDGIVEVVVVHVTAVNVDLSAEFRPKLAPITLHDVTQIVILSPVFRDFRVDVSCEFVPESFGVAIGSLWGIRGLPNVPLLARSLFVTQHELQVIVFPGCYRNLPEMVSMTRNFGLLEFTVVVIGILV